MPLRPISISEAYTYNNPDFVTLHSIPLQNYPEVSSPKQPKPLREFDLQSSYAYIQPDMFSAETLKQFPALQAELVKRNKKDIMKVGPNIKLLVGLQMKGTLWV